MDVEVPISYLSFRSRCGFVNYAGAGTYFACSADGESNRRIAERLGMTQRTLSRWIRKARQAGAGVRQLAIVPAEHRRAAPPAHLAGD